MESQKIIPSVLPTTPREILRRLRKRGLTVSRMAELSGLGRAHLSQVFHGRRSGVNTAWRVAGFLLKEEIAAMGWEKHAEKAGKKGVGNSHAKAAKGAKAGGGTEL